MVQTKILEPLDFNAKTANKEEIAQNKLLKRNCYLNLHTDIKFNEGDTDLNIISIEDFLQTCCRIEMLPQKSYNILSTSYEDRTFYYTRCIQRKSSFETDD